MKNLLVVGILLFTVPVYAAAVEEEVPVEGVLLPHRGFDDNDNVQMLITGELPHACYTLGKTVLERREGNVLRVHQFAWLTTTGVCSGDLDPVSAPYSAEVSIGRLDVGKYTIETLRGSNSVVQTEFGVANAESVNIDDHIYAIVNNVVVPTMSFANEKVKIVVQGLLDGSCESLSSVRVERQKNVFVVLPIIERTAGRRCAKDRSGFSHTIEVDPLKAGQYLVHVRSMNGRAVNRLLQIYPKF